MQNQVLIPKLWALDRIYNTLLKNLSTRQFKAVGQNAWFVFSPERGSPLGQSYELPRLRH
jgi:hypothetical protein